MFRLGVSLSESEVFPPVDCCALEDLEAVKSSSSSSMGDIEVAAVEFERLENFMRLPSAVTVVCVYVDERLVVDFVRL